MKLKYKNTCLIPNLNKFVICNLIIYVCTILNYILFLFLFVLSIVDFIKGKNTFFDTNSNQITPKSSNLDTS